MSLTKITLDMSLKEMIATMAEGNIGAINCLTGMIKNDETSGILNILWLDRMEIRGSKIYILWSDCCNRDTKKFNDTLDFLKSGDISKEEIHKNLEQITAKPFI